MCQEGDFPDESAIGMTSTLANASYLQTSWPWLISYWFLEQMILYALINSPYVETVDDC